MEFEWDEEKRASNIIKHGFDFIDVWQLFDREYIQEIARVGEGGEERLLATGFVLSFPATVIYTMRDDAMRIISLRKARTNEQRRYQAIYGTSASRARPEG